MHMEKEPYVKPEILVTYSKEKLEAAIRPHGSVDSYTNGDPYPGGCGCGGGS